MEIANLFTLIFNYQAIEKNEQLPLKPEIDFNLINFFSLKFKEVIL